MRRLMMVSILATVCCGCDHNRGTCTTREQELEARALETREQELEARLEAQSLEVTKLIARIDILGQALLASPPGARQKAQVEQYFREQAVKIRHENGGHLPRVCEVYVSVPGGDHAYWRYVLTNDLAKVRGVR